MYPSSDDPRPPSAERALPKRTPLTTVEAAWWAMRPNFYSNAVPAVAGLYAATVSPSGREVVGVVVFVALMGGLLQLVNDILDHEKDGVTAPYLPIPSGLLGLVAAKAAAALLFASALAALLFATDPTIRFVWALGATAVTVVLSVLYSLLKNCGVLASACVALVYAGPAFLGWLVAGGEGWLITLVLLDCFLAMFFGNTWAALRDVDADATVGNRTLPVRIGASRAFLYSYIGSTSSYVVLVALALVAPDGRPALVLVALLVGWVLLNGPKVTRTFRIADRGRAQRSRDLRPLFNANAWRNCVLVAAFSIRAGLTALVLLETLNWLQRRAYQRRLLDGELLRRTGGVLRPGAEAVASGASIDVAKR